MHATEVLDTSIGQVCQTMHQGRFGALKVAVEAALSQRCVSVTGLGRAIEGKVDEKHSIKRMDRLVGNNRLLQEAPAVYRAMMRWLLTGIARPMVIVDWSPLTPDNRLHVLRASLSVSGRALTLYQEVHERRDLGSRAVQTDFLHRLAALLPDHCQPVVITDAGFKNPWFRAVEALGWDWVGRIRGTTQLTRPGEEKWLRCTFLGKVLRTGKPLYLGTFQVARSNPVECSVYGLRKIPKGRVRRTRFGQKAQSKHSQAAAHREREPWLIVTSLSDGEKLTRQVLAAYRKRMTIEEGFRDTKSEYYGLGLDRARSRSTGRFALLLLINSLALFTAWLFGKAAHLKKLHRRYQANTVTGRNVLSATFLGLRVIRRQALRLDAELLARIRGSLCESEFGAAT